MSQDLDMGAAQLFRDQINQLALKKAEIDQNIIRIENQIQDFKESDDALEELKATIEEIQRSYNKAPRAVKKRLFKRMFNSVVLSATGIELHYQMTPDRVLQGTREIG